VLKNGDIVVPMRPFSIKREKRSRRRLDSPYFWNAIAIWCHKVEEPMSSELAKSLTLRLLRMRRVILYVMHFASDGCSLRCQICWELMVWGWGSCLWSGFRATVGVIWI